LILKEDILVKAIAAVIPGESIVRRIKQIRTHINTARKDRCRIAQRTGQIARRASEINCAAPIANVLSGTA